MAEQHTPTSELQRQLQLLGEQFAERLAQELPELANKAELLQAGDHQAQLQQLRGLRDQLHKLAGAAGTFGFASIGQRAHELEQQAIHWLESLRLKDQGLQEFIQQLQLALQFTVRGGRFSHGHGSIFVEPGRPVASGRRV